MRHEDAVREPAQSPTPLHAHRTTVVATTLFALLCAYVFVCFLPQGLWEDGYFFLRFARNTWQHGMAAWNVTDGPVHGMTSQAYQLLTAALYPLSPRHMVTACKAVAALSLIASASSLFRLLPPTRGHLARLSLVGLTLGLPLVLNHMTTGLETLLAFAWLSLWIPDYLRFREGGSSALRMCLFVVGTYLLRPDAVLIPGVAVALCAFEQRRRTLSALCLAGAILALFLLGFRLYYGTALPLAFYVKSWLLTRQGPTLGQIYFFEKVKNALQFGYLYAPLMLIAWRGRTKAGLALLASALVFSMYHLILTVETMGHFSRFYIPALPTLLAAALLGWERFRAQWAGRAAWLGIAIWLVGYAVLKAIDQRSGVYIYIPATSEVMYLLGMAMLLSPPTRWETRFSVLAGLCVGFGAVLAYHVTTLDVGTDRAILRRQIKPRSVFFGLEEVARLNPAHVYHTDMGAPGMLLPDTKVTDLDGLLNEEMLLAHKTFSQLCERDKPEAIFVPPARLYPILRSEILASECYRDYKHLPKWTGSRLAIRKDKYPAFAKLAVKLLSKQKP